MHERDLLTIVPLLILGLDNTLVDRDAIVEFLTAHGQPHSDPTSIVGLEASGYTARADVAAAIAYRYGARDPDNVAVLHDGLTADDSVAVADAASNIELRTT